MEGKGRDVIVGKEGKGCGSWKGRDVVVGKEGKGCGSWRWRGKEGM